MKVRAALGGWRLLLVVCGVFLLGGLVRCGEAVDEEPLASQESPVVYGADDRYDVYEYMPSVWYDLAHKSAVALMDPSDIDTTDPSNVTFYAPTLEEYIPLCSDERFLTQPTAAFCSGTLIDDDLVMTAGHCIRRRPDCRNTAFVFNYVMTSETSLAPVTIDDVFYCEEIVVREETSTVDYAIVRIDRPATPQHEPAFINAAPEAVPVDSPLVVIGCPTGLPLKIDAGGWIRENRAATLDYFVANTDSFGGNSGSGVYRADTGEVVGILVRGVTDYVYSYWEGCYRVNWCPDLGCNGEESTYAFRAVDAFCAGHSSPLLCPAPPECGDGVCNGDETTASCPGDCGTECGDGVCNGDESYLTCLADCPAPVCGDGVCEWDETFETCPVDCPEFYCGDGVCGGAADGETCDSCPDDCACLGKDCKKGCCGDGVCTRWEPEVCPVDCG